MDVRYVLTLLLVIIVAAGVGLIMAQSQSKLAAAPVPTVVATPIAPPPSGLVGVYVGSKVLQGYAVEIAQGGPPNQGGQYIPPKLVVHKGDTVIWGNVDASAAHSATADDGSFDSGVLAPYLTNGFQADNVYQHKFTKPGIYPYSDYLHAGMHGEIVVKP